MACHHLAPNGEKSLLYQTLEQKYGPDKAHDLWEQVRSQQFLNKHGDWLDFVNYRNTPNARSFSASRIPVDVNGEPQLKWVEDKLRPSNFKPANEQQTNAISSIRNFVDKGNPSQFLTVEGKAGTGKTTIVAEAIAPYVERGEPILIAALSHKAKLNLQDKLEDRFGPDAVSSHTIAGALGMGMDVESGKFSPEFGSDWNEKPVERAKIIIIDEASMVNEESMQLLMEMKRPDAKVIFLGDRGQLPPIREKGDKNTGKPSPSFTTPNKAQLTERVRQGEESPILPYADKFWENSQKAAPSENPAPEESRKSAVTDKGSLVFAKSATVLPKVLPYYKKAVETGNPDVIKTVVYRNETRQLINNKVRQYLFGDEASKQFVKGDLVMFQDNFEQNKVKISNSTEVQIKQAKSITTKDGWKAWQVGFALDGRPIETEVLDKSEAARYNTYLDKLANEAKALPKGTARTIKWKEFYREKARFAPVDYSYAITSHKSQGSTYDMVLVGESDINSVGPISAKEKSQSIYTAITRAKHAAFIMDGKHDDPHMVDAAISRMENPTTETKAREEQAAPAPEPAPAQEAKTFKGQMTFDYGANKRPGIDASSTLEAIRMGERTATTRYESDGHLDYWKQAKVGDIIEFTGKNGQKVNVEVTKPLTKIDNISAAEWSKKEGWSEAYFNKNVKPKLNQAWQMEYKYVPKATAEAKPTPAPAVTTTTLKEAQAGTMNVYHGTGENPKLSNLATRPFEFEGKKYLSVEHAYQANKSGAFDQATFNKYKKGEQKIAGTKGTKTADGWNMKLMENLVRASFEQNPDAKKLLLDTGDKLITHKQDKGIWADEFPKILMRVRKELQGTTEATPAPVPEVPLQDPLNGQMPEKETITRELGTSKNMTKGEFSEQVDKLYEEARQNPDKIYKLPYQYISDKHRYPNGLTAREMAEILDRDNIPQNVDLGEGLRQLTETTQRRIIAGFGGVTLPEFIHYNEPAVLESAAKLLIPKTDAQGNPDGFFDPQQQEELVNAITSITERQLRQNPLLKANALVKTLGLFHSKYLQARDAGDEKNTAVFGSIHGARVQLTELALQKLGEMGLTTDSETAQRILDAVDQIRPMTEQEKGQWMVNNPEAAASGKEPDPYSGDFMESVGRITRDWSENSFELDPKDTASARIKFMMGTQYDMDKGVYEVSETGEKLDTELPSDLNTLPAPEALKLARSLSRKPFFYKDQASSEKLRDWLQARYPRFAKLNFLGTAKTADFDQIFRETLNTLGNNPQGLTFDQAMGMLDTNPNPTIQEMARQLRTQDQSLKNEFMTVMMKQYQPFIMAIFDTIRGEDGNPAYVLRPIMSNRFGQRETLINLWKEQQKISPIMTEKGGERVLDVQKIQKQWVPALEKARSITDWSKPENMKWAVKTFGDIFRQSGIDLTPDMMRELLRRPGNYTSSPSIEGLFSVAKNGAPTGPLSIFIAKSAGMLALGEQRDPLEKIRLSQLNNPLYTENTLMQGLAKLAAKHTAVLYSQNHRNSSGDSVWDWGMNTKLSHQFRSLMTDFDNVAAQLQQTNFHKDNWLVEYLKDNPGQLKDMELSYFDGLRPEWSSKGTPRSDMSDREQLLTSILLFQNRGNGFNTQPKVNYMSLTHGDKTMTPVFRNMPRLDMGRAGIIPSTIIGRADSKFMKLFLAEHSRIVNQADKDSGVQRYEQGKGLFYIFPEFNYDSMKKMAKDGVIAPEDFTALWTGGQRSLTKIIGSKEQEVINRVLRTSMRSMIDNTLNKWQEVDIVNEEGNRFDSAYAKKLMALNGITSKNKEGKKIGDTEQLTYTDTTGKVLAPKEVHEIIAETAAKDYALNNFLFNAGLSQLFYGDPAESYKKSKLGNTDMDHVKSTMIEYTKRLAKDIAPRADLYWEADKRKYTAVTLKDVETTSKFLENVKELRKAYVDEKTNATDAQELTTVQEKLDVLMAAGKIDSKIYSAMSEIVKKAGGGYYEFELPEHRAVIMQPEKPLYAGARPVQDGRMLSDYIKSAAYALYPPLTRGMEIDGLRRTMEKNGIARAAFESAQKLGAPTRPLQAIRPDGSFVEPDAETLKASMHLMDRGNFGIQQEVPYDPDKEEIKTLTQMNENITEGIGEIEGFKMPGHPDMNGRELQQYRQEVRKKLIEANKKTFDRSLNIDEDGNLDPESIYDMLTDQAKRDSRGTYSLNEIQSLVIRDKDGTPMIPLMFSTSSSKFESTLMGRVNAISDVKVPGKSLVQISGMGYKVVDPENADLSKVIRVGGWDGSTLKGMRLEDGVVKPGQVILPLNFFAPDGTKLKLEDFMVDGKIDPRKLPPELLQLIGGRVPNQKHSSIHALEVVGFVPDNMGDIIIIPPELVKQMGADFDVDKLYTYKRPYYYHKESGELIPIKAAPHIEVHQGYKGETADNRHYNYWTLKKKEAANYGPKVRTANVDTTDFLFKHNKGGGWNEEYTALRKEFMDAGHANPDILMNDKPGLATMNAFFKFLESKGYKGYAEYGRGEDGTPLTEENAYVVTFGKQRGLTSNDHDALLNEYFNLHWSILTHPDMLTKVLAPLDKSDLVDESQLLREKSTGYSNFFESNYQLEDFQRGKEAKRLVGTSSWSVKMNARMQNLNMRYAFQTAEGPQDAFITVRDEHTGKEMQLHRLSGNGTSFYTKEDGEKITDQNRAEATRSKVDNHVLIQSEAVDNMKNRTLDPLNLTPETYKAAQALIQLETKDGWAANSKYWTRLLTQPIIKDYVREIKQGNDALSNGYDPFLHQTVMKKLMGKYGELAGSDPDKSAPDNIVFDPQLLLKAPTMKGEEFGQHQVAALQLFGKLYDIGQRLFEIESLFNQDVGGAGKDLLSVLDRHDKIGNLEQSPILGTEGLLFGPDKELTEIGATYVATARTAMDVVGKVLPYRALRPLFTDLQSMTGRSVLTQDQQKALIKGFKSMVFSSSKAFWNEPQAERARLLFGPESLARRVAIAKRTWGTEDPLLARLSTKIGVGANDASFVEYPAAAKIATQDRNAVVSSWLHLLTSTDPERKALGEDLLRYTYLTGGIQDSNSMAEFVPVPYVANTEFTGTLKDMETRLLSNDGPYENEAFLIQHIQHFPELATRIPPSAFGEMPKGREYPETFDSQAAGMFRTGAVEDDKYLPFVSYFSRPENRWILYMHNPVGETHFYTRVDTLGNKYTDEYNGLAPAGQRSLFQENRSLAERVPSLDPISEILSLSNNTLWHDRVGADNPYAQIGIKEGDEAEMVRNLDRISEDQRLAEYQRTVAKFFSDFPSDPMIETSRHTISYLGAKGIKLKTEFDPKAQTAGAVNFLGHMVINPRRAYTLDRAAEVYLHEMTHARLHWAVWMGGFDGRMDKAYRDNGPENRAKLAEQQQKFQRQFPEAVKVLKELDQLRYQAHQELENRVGSGRMEELRQAIEEGHAPSEEHTLHYATSTLQEFVAHILTNKDTMEFLNSIQSVHPEGFLHKVWSSVIEVLAAIGKALGIKVRDGSVLKESITRVMQLHALSEASQYKAPDVSGALLHPQEITVKSEQMARDLSQMFNATYERPSESSTQGLDWTLQVNEIKSKDKRHTVIGQRGKVLDHLYQQRDDISEALNRARDIKERVQLRVKQREIREQINTLSQENNIANIAVVGRRQMEWVDEVLKSKAPTTTSVNLALETTHIWENLIDILYGDLGKVDAGQEFKDLASSARDKRIELMNTKAREVINEEVKPLGVTLTPMDYKEKLEDISGISSQTLALVRAKPLVVQSVAAMGWRDANNRDEHIFRNTQRLQALEQRMKSSGLSDDMLITQDPESGLMGLTDRLSVHWFSRLKGLRENLDSNLTSIEKTENLTPEQRAERRKDAWNKHWEELKTDSVFVDTRHFLDVGTGETKENPEQFQKLAEKVGSEAYARELIRDASKKYKDYLTEREAYKEWMDQSVELTDEEKKDKTTKDQEEALNQKKVDRMRKWLQYNSPVELLDRLDKGKNINFNSEGDQWIVMAPHKDASKYWDDNYKKIDSDPERRKAYDEYREILSEMTSYLPAEVQDKLPDNFIPIVPKDTTEWLAKLLYKVKNWDTEMLKALAATDAEEASRLRPDKIPVMYTKPFGQTRKIENRSTDAVRILESFSMMALQHRYMGHVLDLINIAQNVFNEISVRRAQGLEDGKELRHIQEALKYFKDMLVFRKPKELQGRVDNPLHTVQPFKEMKIQREIKSLLKEKEDLNHQMEQKMVDGDYDHEAEEARIEKIDEKLEELDKEARNLYGSKIVDALISVNQMKSLGFNPFSAVTNYSFAEVSLSIHARGRMDFDPKTLRQSNGIMIHAMKNFWFFQNHSDPIAKKIHNLMARAGIMGDVVDTDYGHGTASNLRKKSKLRSAAEPFGWQKAGDYFTKGKLLTSMLLKHQVEVETLDGKKETVSLWDAFDEDGKWDTSKYKPNQGWYSEDIHQQQDWMNYRDRIRKVSMMVFGNQDKNAPMLAKKNWVWRLAAQFRMSWFPEGIATRWKDEYQDVNLGRAVKGRWKTYQDLGLLTSGMVIAKQLLHVLPGIKGSPFDGATLKGKDGQAGKPLIESELDIENMRRNFAGLAWTAGFVATILILQSMAKKMHKKDSEERMRQLLVNMLIRNQQDLMLYSSPSVFNTISGNFLPATQVVVDYWNAVTATSRFLFKDHTHEKHALHSWIMKVTRAGIPHPYFALYNKAETMLTRDLDKLQR